MDVTSGDGFEDSLYKANVIGLRGKSNDSDHKNTRSVQK